MYMNIEGIQKLTLLDFPGHVACTVFLKGCNFCCPFCYNSSLINERTLNNTLEDDFYSFLKSRQGILDGVAITGGEPLLQKGIKDFITKIRALGYKVKLDTNGSFPDVLQELIEEKLVDYVAMDIKNSWNKYDLTSGAHYLKEIEKSISILLSNKVDYEFRTTVVKQLHSKEDFEIIGQMIQGAKNYFIQRFQENESVIDKKLSAPDKEELIEYLTIVKKYVPNAMLRGID